MNILSVGLPGGPEIMVILFILSPLVLTIAALISILRNEFNDGTTKLIWVLVAILLPILGPILYFAIGRKQQLRFQS